MKKGDNLGFVFEHLDFWLNAFSKKDKYNIYIYNENIEELPEKYKKYKVVNKEKIVGEKESCAKVLNTIKNSNIIDDRWKGAAFALSVPYFYLDEEIVWNIDADDLKLEGPIEKYIEKLEKYIEDLNVPILGSDIYLSVPNNSWSFGIAIAKTDWFRQLLDTILITPVYKPGWGVNIDHMVDQYFKHHLEFKVISFTTPDWFVHGGVDGLWSRFDVNKNACVCNLYNKDLRAGQKNVRSLLIM